MASSVVDAKVDLKQENEFSHITRIITQSQKTNPLFYFISENLEALKKEGIEVQALQTPEGNAYYLIRIFEKKPPFDLTQTAEGHHLIPGYECMHKHLRIDQYYASDKSERGMQGFVFAHFTEQYQHACKNEKIDIHVHLNNKAQFKGVKIKIPKGFDKENFLFPANNQCYDNAQPAKRILENLLHRFTVRYVALSNEIEALFTALRALSLDFRQATNREAYIRIGTMLIEKINVLNNHNDLEKDQRDKSVAQVIIILRNHREPAAQNIRQVPIEESEETREDIDISVVEPTAQPATSKCPEVSKVLKLQKRLKELMRLADNLDKKIEVFLISKDLKKAQFDLILLEKYRRTIIESVDSTLRKVVTIENLLNTCFEEGNVVKFKSIFFHAQNQTELFNCILNWIIKTYNQKDKTLQNLYIEICDFLCENSYVYSLCINLMRAFMPGPEGRQHHLNLLTLSIMRQDFEFSSMLLRQGFSTTQFGVYFYDRPVALLKYILTHHHIQPRFIKLLLAHHADVDTEPTMEPHTMVYIKPLSYFKPNDKTAVSIAKRVLSNISVIISESTRHTLQKQAVINSIETEEYIKQLIIAPDLVIASYVASITQNYSIAIMMQEKSDVFSQALTLAMVMEHSGIICHLNPTQDAFGLRCVADRNEAIRLVTGRESNYSMQYMFYPYSPEFSGRFTLVQKICDSLRSAQTTNPEKIMTAFQKLESAILEKKSYLLDSENHFATLQTYYRACIFLSSYQRYSNQGDCLKVMQYNCRIASLVESDPKHAWMYFNNAYNIARYSMYFKTLQDTLEFTEITLGMQKTHVAQLNQRQSPLQRVKPQNKPTDPENKKTDGSISATPLSAKTNTSVSETDAASQTKKKKKKKK